MNDKRKRKQPLYYSYEVAYVSGLEKHIKLLEKQVAQSIEIIHRLTGPQTAPTISETNKQ